jgi:hypothetical protein
MEGQVGEVQDRNAGKIGANTLEVDAHGLANTLAWG